MPQPGGLGAADANGMVEPVASSSWWMRSGTFQSPWVVFGPEWKQRPALALRQAIPNFSYVPPGT